jgi:hypothetical protein
MSKFVDTLQGKMKIKHVFPCPSNAYGPGTVLMYEKKSGYTRTCFGWEVLGIPKEKYPKYWIISNLANVAREGSIEFKIKLSEKEKLDIGTEFNTASACKIALSNGRQFDISADIGTLVDNTQKGACARAIRKRKSANHRADFYLSLITYSYDLEFQIKTEMGWILSAKIPQGVFDIITPKIDISLDKKESYSVSGKQLFVGFNGDQIPIPASTLKLPAAAYYKSMNTMITRKMPDRAALLNISSLFIK